MRKRKTLLILLVLFSMFIYGCAKEGKKVISQNNSIQKENIESSKDNIEVSEEIIDEKENEIVEEMKTIVIDPGHSSVGNKEKEPIAPNSSTKKTKDVLGATGVATNIPEHITTVKISNLLQEKLSEMGFNVIMTKTKVEESLSNIERAQIGNENNADLVVRIHADSAGSQEAKGASILVPPKNQYTNDISDISKKYGETIIDIYTSELGIKNRGVIYRDDMTGFNWSKVPVVILEMGFLSNKEEDLFLSDTNNHEKIASTIANGIKACFE